MMKSQVKTRAPPPTILQQVGALTKPQQETVTKHNIDPDVLAALPDELRVAIEQELGIRNCDGSTSAYSNNSCTTSSTNNHPVRGGDGAGGTGAVGSAGAAARTRKEDRPKGMAAKRKSFDTTSASNTHTNNDLKVVRRKANNGKSVVPSVASFLKPTTSKPAISGHAAVARTPVNSAASSDVTGAVVQAAGTSSSGGGATDGRGGGGGGGGGGVGWQGGGGGPAPLDPASIDDATLSALPPEIVDEITQNWDQYLQRKQQEQQPKHFQLFAGGSSRDDSVT
jgi:hypothetical protein